MEKITYPLLYYQLKSDAVLGMLIGTDYQVIDKDLKAVKNRLSRYLQKQYKKHDEYWYMDIVEARLKIVEVKIRPTYREQTGSYPMSQALTVPVPTVYGETVQGYYECYLPLLEDSFYYYDARQFGSLVQYIASDLLNRLSPEQLYRQMMYGQPQLDHIVLKVNQNREIQKFAQSYEREYKILNRLTVKYPYPKALRKKISTFPEVAWELEHVVAETVDKLSNLRTNLLIVGEHGVGKSAVLRQAIRKISAAARKEGPDLTFWQLMSQRITASAKYMGEWQETCELMVEELKSANGILWVVDIIRLLETGGQGAEDSVAAFLASFLQQGQLQIVGEVTKRELDSMIRLLPGFVENFQQIHISELPENKVQLILDRFAEYAEKNRQIVLTKDALAMTYRLLLRYYPYERFPGKAVKFLGQCISDALLREQDKVRRADVMRLFIQQTGLPELFLRDDLLLDKKDLHHYFTRNIIGQPKAVNRLSDVVKIFKAGLNNPDKPIATMIFSDLSQKSRRQGFWHKPFYPPLLDQQKSPLIRIDMSEFQHPGQISRFIGAGREMGKLVQDIRERPFSVLLLDEVEKAVPAVFDTLLTVLDEGILVDAFGRVTNFRNTIIIMTTNLGASNRQSIGFRNSQSDEANYLSAIGAYFRPEFVNRIDHIVMFNPLSAQDIEKITRKELQELKQREGFVKRALDLQFSEALIKHLSGIGFDERYGARPLQRAIEQTLINPMANWLLENPSFEEVVLHLDYDGQLSIKVASP
ncbi:MAG: AAA family ATPase [Bacteroidota bacterium]